MGSAFHPKRRCRGSGRRSGSVGFINENEGFEDSDSELDFGCNVEEGGSSMTMF